MIDGDERNVVVLHRGTCQLVKLCADREAYEEWFEKQYFVDRDELRVVSARVYEGEE